MLIILEVELLVSYLEAMKTALVIVITSKTKFELTFADAESKGKENELVLYREYQRSTRIHMRSPSTLYPGFYGDINLPDINCGFFFSLRFGSPNYPGLRSRSYYLLFILMNVI